MQNFLFVTQNTLNRKVSGFLAWLVLAAGLAVLAGCGSGQAIPSVPPPAPPGTAPTAATLQLLTSNTQIDSSGTTTVDLTAVVLSSTKQAVSGRTVTFSAPPSPETAFINNISGSGVSDSNGLVTAKLNLGGNKLNRNILVSATADSASATNSVVVNGTTLSVTGNTSIALGNVTTLIYTLKDSASTGIPSISLTVKSTDGNPVCVRASAAVAGSPCPSGAAATVTSTTNGAGQLIVDVVANLAPGNSDTLTASINDALTNMASVSTALTITSATFAFQPLVIAGQPAGTTDIEIGTEQVVSIRWTDPVNGVPAGTQVNFSTTRGTISNLSPTDCTTAAATAVTDSTGKACIQIFSTLAGPAIITAAGVPATTSPAATLAVAFVSRSVANVTVQAVPGTVAVTSGAATQTNNTSTITATVRDGSGVGANLVKNAGITFTLTDQTGGTLSSGTARTDITGSATVIYTAGKTSSAANGVTIKATVTDVTGAVPPIIPVSSCTITTPGATTCPSAVPSPEVAGYPDAALTVANQPLLVRVGTDNLVGGTAPNNQKTYLAVVTDASGNASVGTTVRFALRPSRYAKGVWVRTVTNWVQSVSVVCVNEDINFNGSLDPGEDFNNNGVLDPGGVASVTPSAVTDANGIAAATITYPKDRSYWVEVTLEARAGVVGNDAPTKQTFWLPGPSPDYTDLNTQPPGQPSPYGVDTTCADTF